MKILFLDMDGVLNSTQSAIYFHRTKHNRKTFMQGFEELCPIACSNLNFILEKLPDIKIVISSTWRLHHSLAEWDEKMKTICPEIVGRVIDRTPGRDDGERGDEIYRWLEKNNHLHTPFVVLDDNSDMEKVKKNFIQTDETCGFTFRDAMKVLKHFGIENGYV